MPEILLVLLITFSHVCLLLGVLYISNNVKMNEKCDNDTADGRNSADSSPEYTALIELFRFLIITICAVSLSRLSVAVVFS